MTPIETGLPTCEARRVQVASRQGLRELLDDLASELRTWRQDFDGWIEVQLRATRALMALLEDGRGDE